MPCRSCNRETNNPDNNEICSYCGKNTNNEGSIAEMYSDSPQPWTRFIARLFDMQIFYIFLIGMAYLLEPIVPILFEIMQQPPSVLFVVLLWVLVESTLLTKFGTTLGKKLAGLRIIHRTELYPPFHYYFKRSLGVYLMGIGLGLPFIDIIAMVFSYRTLVKHKITVWDKNNDFQVIHEKNNKKKVISLAILLLLIYATLIILGNSD